MATHLSIINNIMTRIREAKVSGSEDHAYAGVVSETVAQAYEEVIDEWDWRTTITSATYTIPINTYRYDLTGNAPNEPPPVIGHATSLVAESRIVRESGRAQVYASTVPDTARYTLKELALPGIQEVISRDTDAVSNQPRYFAMDPQPDGSMEVILYPAAEAAPFDMTFVFYDRPSALLADGTTDQNTILIPYRPVQELALMYVLNERGEEIGEPGNLAEMRYYKALAAAKESDIKAAEHSNVYDWGRD